MRPSRNRLIVNTNSIGGSGSSHGGDRYGGGRCPWASISTAISNGGWAEANTDARGGVGGIGSGGASGGAGGDSVSVATASTAGDGNRVDVTGLAGYYGSAGNGGYVTGGVAGQRWAVLVVMRPAHRPARRAVTAWSMPPIMPLAVTAAISTAARQWWCGRQRHLECQRRQWGSSSVGCDQHGLWRYRWL